MYCENGGPTGEGGWLVARSGVGGGVGYMPQKGVRVRWGVRMDANQELNLL